MNYIDIDREDQRRREAREHRRALRMRRDKKKKMLIGFAVKRKILIKKVRF